MKRKNGFVKGALLGALIMLIINVAGVLSYSSRLSREDNDVVNTKMKILQTLVDTYYKGEIESEKMQEGILKGYINGLGDPYSAYLNEEETTRLTESTTGEFSGIGALMSQDAQTGIITIVRVYDDSPAQKAGLEEGDILYKVSGEEVTGQDLNQVVSRIRGEEGTDVEIVVLRGEEAEEIAMTATRATIQAISVDAKMLDSKIGYILVTEFDENTTKQYEDALTSLEEQGMQGLIVDLRSNPGGNLDTVVDMLDIMLPEGTVVSMKDNQEEETVYTSDEEHQFTKPLAVLMNQYSASASEIYAGAIQDFGTGVIVGTTSYGKGVVQKIYDLQDGTCLKLTIAEYYTPNGRNINGIGIQPDEVVEYEPETEGQYDSQLQKAVEIIQNKL